MLATDSERTHTHTHTTSKPRKVLEKNVCVTPVPCIPPAACIISNHEHTLAPPSTRQVTLTRGRWLGLLSFIPSASALVTPGLPRNVPPAACCRATEQPQMADSAAQLKDYPSEGEYFTIDKSYPGLQALHKEPCKHDESTSAHRLLRPSCSGHVRSLPV